MSFLQSLASDPQTRPRIIQAALLLLDGEVKQKSGLSGMAIKTAYSVVKAISPGILHDAMERLLDPFAQKIDPFIQQWQQQANKTPLQDFFQQHASAIANALLTITDEKIQHAQNRTLKSTYGKLRPMALGHVESATPGMANMIDTFLPPSNR